MTAKLVVLYTCGCLPVWLSGGDCGQCQRKLVAHSNILLSCMCVVGR